MINLPNWCENKLTIKGTNDELERFENFAKGKDKGEDYKILDEENFIPYPEKFKKQDEKAREYARTHKGKWIKDGFNSGGYEWCSQNWGTKWGFCDVFVRRTKDLIYEFNTAWSPPMPLFFKMCEMFPILTFKLEYWECGVGFKGSIKARGTEILNEIESDKYHGHRGG